MRYILSKKVLILAITTLLILVTIPSFSSEIEETNKVVDLYDEPVSSSTAKGTHTVLAEYGTSTTCGYCKYANQALKNIYWGGAQDLCVVTFVAQNSYSSSRFSEYNLYGYPTVWFDGGYQVVVGAGSTSSAQANYNSAIDQCEVYSVYDVDLQLSANWLGSATMQISVSVQNNEASTYDGHIRVYVIEKNSTYWHDTNNQPYGFAFLNYAFNQDISIGVGNTWQSSTVWNGNDYGFGSITQDNTMVVAAVFNDDWHQGYSYPPSTNPFDAYYVDESTIAIPVLDNNPPEISNVLSTPPVQTSGDYVNTSADVIDDSDVDQVKAVITYPDMSSANETMAEDSGDTYYLNDIYSMIGTYSYHIWAEDVNGNQNTSSTYTFEIVSPHIADLSQNWNFISLPFNQSIDKADIIVNYSGLDHAWADAVTAGIINDVIFGWNRATQGYEFANTLEPGYGYWIYAYNACELLAPEVSAISDGFITNLEVNWNIVGAPDDQSVDKADVLVNYGGTDYNWADAVTAGYVNDVVFGWNGATQGYEFSDTLMPGYSYWIFAYYDCSLLRTIV